MRYARAFEPGCAAGDLTVLLAQRCDYLLATDGSDRALAQTRDRLSTLHHVNVEKAWLPEDWPEGMFDLIVLSEFLYYLPAPDLDRLLRQVAGARTSNGAVVACHWRAPIEGCAIAGDALHEVLHSRLGLPRVVHHQDDDFTLDVWQEGVSSASVLSLSSSQAAVNNASRE